MGGRGVAMSIIRPVVATAAWVLIATPSAGLLVSQDLVPGSGDGLVTYDTQSGLEWLDLTATINASYNEVWNGYGSFTTNHGFRFAELDVVLQLYSNAGAWYSGYPGDEASAPGAKQLLDLMGSTNSSTHTSPDPYYGTYTYLTSSGMHDRGDMNGIPEASSYVCNLTVRIRSDGNLINGAHDCGITGLDVDTPSPHYGSYLVRAIPEPSTGLLVSLGLVGLASTRPRKSEGVGM
jgi:PEP-CTERM motif